MQATPPNPDAGRPEPKPAGPAPRSGWSKYSVGVVAALALCFLWAYWPTLEHMAERWARDPQYSHGFLVPVFALVVLWSRRELRPASLPAPSWWGLAWLLAGVVLRLTAAHFYLEPLDAFSLLPSLAGVTLLVGGRPTLRWAWPAIAFLGFMLPLPFQVDMALAHPLRRVATVASTYALQTLGFPALAEGNIIIIEDLRLGVIDACSGLGMLMTFFALATAAALVIDRRPADKVVIVASAIPIALIANVVRITATGLAHLSLGTEAGHLIMHDLAGWLMMPLALGLLWLELRFLAGLFQDVEDKQPLPLGLPGTARDATYPRKANVPVATALTLEKRTARDVPPRQYPSSPVTGGR